VIVRWGIEELPPLLEELGVERAMLVTSSRFATLDLAVASRFAGVRRHSPVETVAAATEAARDADGLVGLGGGSAIDTAKAVAPNRAAGGLHPDDLLRSRMDIGFQGSRPGPRAQARRGCAWRILYEQSDAQPSRQQQSTALNALAHCAGPST
jgi:hypothetical protein